MRAVKLLLRVAAVLIVLLGLAVATRSYWLPERYAVNVPWRSLMGRGESAPAASVERTLQVPAGFAVSRFATNLKNARFLQVTDAGDVIVSQPREGLVTLLRASAKGGGVSDGLSVLLKELDRPHGLALHDGYLYVAEMTAVGRIHFDAQSRATSGAFERVITGLPSGGNHWTRTIAFGPDGFLYVSVGSSCNVCVETDKRRAAISRYDPRSWKGEVYASGLRNSVGLAWRGVGEGAGASFELIATDNGRDLLGDDFPPCELNRVVEGGFYGWPFANGDRVEDPDLGAGHNAEIAASLPPIHKFAAHNAPLGIAFLNAPTTPDSYRGAALVALHGSWNRSRKDGYKVVSLHWGADNTITQRDFLTGFLNDDSVIGRPVDIAQGRDGAIYISDDLGGSIFRVTQGATAAATSAVVASQTPEDLSAGVQADDKTIARGEKVWISNRCDQCHDPRTMAEAAPKTTKVLEHLTRKYDVPRLVTYLKAPTPPMPLVELSETERRDLAAYVLDRFR